MHCMTSHLLTLQTQKTNILTAQEFSEQILDTPALRELRLLRERFDTILQELGIDNPYEDLDYDDLPPQIQDKSTPLT